MQQYQESAGGGFQENDILDIVRQEDYNVFTEKTPLTMDQI